MHRLRKILLNPGQKYDKLDDRLLSHDLKEISNKSSPEEVPKNQMVPTQFGEEGYKIERTSKPT